MLALGLLGLAGAALTDWTTEQADNYRLDEDYIVAPAQTRSFVATGNRYCAGNNIHVAVHMVEQAREAACINKCPAGVPLDELPADCDGKIAAYDGPDAKDVVCLEEDECKALCLLLPECHSLDVAKDQDHHKRCYLNTISCEYDIEMGLAEDPNYNFVKKVVEITDACDLGYGARITGSPDPHSVTGIYDLGFVGPDTDIEEYTKVGGGGRIVWHKSHCGWAVEKELPSEDERQRRKLGNLAACPDAPAVAAAALGLPASDDEVCQRAAWAPAYCADPLFAAFCPTTCAVPEASCAGDHTAAAEKIAANLGVTGGCAELTKYCTSDIVNTVCTATCAAAPVKTSRRGKAAFPAGNFSSAFRQSLRSVNARRLGFNYGEEESYYEVYYSFKASVPPAVPDDCGPTAPVLADTSILYDVFALMVPLTQEWEQSCGVLPTYRTIGGMYCPHNNIQTYASSGYTPLPELAAARCVTKCENPMQPGCPGLEPNYDDATSNALCLPRAECEALCTTLSAAGIPCSSFDMHQTKPRCFLNLGSYCHPGENEGYNTYARAKVALESGIYEPGEYDFVYLAYGIARYSTNDLMECAGIPYEVATSKHSCEMKCSLPDFTWKVVHNGRPNTTNGTANFSDHFHEYHDTESGKALKIDDGFVLNFQYSTVALGAVNSPDGELYFGPLSVIPLPADSHATWGKLVPVMVPRMQGSVKCQCVGEIDGMTPHDYGSYCRDWDGDGAWCYVDDNMCDIEEDGYITTHHGYDRSFYTCSVKDSSLQIFVEYPGLGIGMLYGEIDYKNYAVEFLGGEPVFLQGTNWEGAKNAFVSSALFPGGAWDAATIVSVTTMETETTCTEADVSGAEVNRTVIDACAPATSFSVYSLSVSDSGVTASPLYTEGSFGLEDCLFTYYESSYYTSYSVQFSASRQLHEPVGGVHLEDEIKAKTNWTDITDWMVASAASEMAVTAAVHSVAGKIVYLIKDGPEVKLQAQDPSAECGFAKPISVGITICEKPVGMPIPDTENILVVCAGRLAVICDMSGKGSCGEVYDDFGTLFNSTDANFSMASAQASEGGLQGECLSDDVCMVMSDIQTFYILGIDVQELTYVQFIDNLADIRDWKIKRSLVMINKETAFISTTVVSSGASFETLTSIQSSFPEDGQAFPVGEVKAFPNSVVGWTHGIIISEKGLTWEYHDPATECLYYVQSEGNVSNADICGSREACEEACTDDERCNGFTYGIGSYRCHFFASCGLVPVPPDEPAITVKKEETAPCKATVTGAVVPGEIMSACPYDMDAAVESTCDVNGDYIKAGTRIYRSPSNTSILYADEDQLCAGWVLAMNTAPVDKIILLTYKDSSAEAVAGVPRQRGGARQLQGPGGGGGGGGGKPAPANCADVASLGLCDETVYGELCMTTCTALTFAQVAGQTKGFHVRYSAAEMESATFDLVSAAAEYFALLNSTATSCADVCSGSKKEMQQAAASAYPEITWKTIQALCPDTCKTRPKTYSKEEVYYLPAEISDFEVVFRTFANGSDFAQEQPGVVFDIPNLDYSQCDWVPPYGYRDFLVSDSKLNTDKIYTYIVEPSSLTMTKVCSTLGRCPTLTTCVIDEDRLIKEHNELGLYDKKLKIGDMLPEDLTALLYSSAWSDYIAPGMTAVDLTDDSILFKFPKVLLTVERTEAIIRVAQWDFGKEIFRPVPDHSRVRLYEAGTAATVFITMSPASEWATLMNYGRTYSILPGYRELMTDVIRIAAFNSTHKKISSGTFTFELWFPESIGNEASFVVYTYIGLVPTPVTEIGGTVGKKPYDPDTEYGWWYVTVPAEYANSDFAGTIDLDECTLGTDGCEKDGGSCINKIGSYECTCDAGYFALNDAKSPAGVPIPSGTHCIKITYEAEDTQFLLYHSEKAEYGWKVGEVMLFEASDPVTGTCMGECKSGSGVFDPNCHYGQTIPEPTVNSKGVLEMQLANSDNTNQYIKNVLVSKTYPGKFNNLPGERLKDGKLGPANEWWSASLEHDRMEGTGAWISFEVDGTSSGPKVNCVRLYMACTAGAMSSFTLFRGKKGTASLERNGPAYATAGLPLYTPGAAGWLEITSATRAKGANYVDFAVPCGIKDAQYFGELFPHNYTDVPTACGCKQLCMDNVDEGCTSWKWYEETEHCILQKNYFSGTDELSYPEKAEVLMEPRAAMRSQYVGGSGWWKLPFSTGWPGWWTGTPGAIVLSMETEPSVVTVGAPFSIILKGVGFPLDESMQNNLGARQRIKIVLAGEGEGSNCGTDVPPEYVEGIGCTNGLTCSSRPEEFDRVSATWSNIKFASSLEETDYKVCWCAGHCYDMASWKEVPGKLKVSASPYSWGLEEPAVLNPYSFEPLAMRVSRPAFSSTAPAADWRVKLVSEDFTCETLGTSTIACDGVTGCAPAGADLDEDGVVDVDEFGYQIGLNLGPDEAIFYLTSGSETGVPPGYYHVCVSEGAGEPFMAAPSLTARFLVVTKLASDPSHPRGPFHHQKFSARAGQDATITVSGYRMFQPNAASVHVFEGDSCMTTSPAVMTLTADPAASTADSYVFTGEVPASAGGKDVEYTLCYCEDKSYSYETATKYTTPLNASLLGELEEDLCVKKCAPGCVGSTCFCEGMEEDDVEDYGMSESGPLCLDAPACRAACDSIEGCMGYSTGVIKPRCFLSSFFPEMTSEVDENYDTWKKEGSTCTDIMATAAEGDVEDEVKKNLGTVFVTKKADLGVSYVVTPNEEASIELTGEGFESGDRIMVIDCFGTCGFTEGSSYVSAPTYAVLPTIDRPSLPQFEMVYPDDSAATYTYEEIDGKYCPGNMLPVVPDTLHAGHLCYKKCYAMESCTDESCFCNGFILGYDTEDSTAVCLNVEQCEWLCSQTPGCHSIDMHKEKDRCFLNMGTCSDTIAADQLVPSEDYNLHVKMVDDNTRRLQDRGKTFSKKLVRQLLAAEDPGISWDKMYRFKDLTFSSGGEFKLCFCDSSILPGENNICDKPEDYTIEVGRIHATGLQCLLNDPKMTKGTCVKQFYGGLRCYDEEAPDVTVPQEYFGVPNPKAPQRNELVTSLISYCQYASEEDAMEFPFCAQYRVYAAAPTPAPTFKRR